MRHIGIPCLFLWDCTRATTGLFTSTDCRFLQLRSLPDCVLATDAYTIDGIVLVIARVAGGRSPITKCRAPVRASLPLPFLVCSTHQPGVPLVCRGWGLFAAEELLLFDFLGVYTGRLHFLDDIPTEERLKNAYLCTFPAKEKGLVANAESHGNYTRFVNHDETHNIFCIHLNINKVPYMALVSSGCSAGAEILWNYGQNYNKNWEGVDEADGIEEGSG